MTTAATECMKGFGALAEAATRDGALTRKTKELIALALGVAGHCDACIGFHLQTLIKLGATRLEVEEALGVAIYMRGVFRAMRATSSAGLRLPWYHRSRSFNGSPGKNI